MTIGIALIQTLLLTVACGALFIGWRALWRRDRRAGMIVAVGLAGRLIAGQLLFWISWLDLPILSGMHAAAQDGFWFFARDAAGYFLRAVSAKEEGLWYLIAHAGGSAPFYLKTLGMAMFFFGVVPAIAVLLNGAAYLGTGVIMARIGGRNELTLAALMAVALSPTAVLWSTQGLKDVTLFFLMAAFVGAAWLWQKAWRGTGSRASVAAALIVVSLAAISGIRWYFAAIFFGMLLPFFAMVAVQSRRRLAAALAGAALIAAVTIAAVAPLWRTVIPVGAALLRARYDPGDVVMFMVMRARRSFDNAEGSTQIGAGRLLVTLDRRAGKPVTADPIALSSARQAKLAAKVAERDPDVDQARNSARERALSIRGDRGEGGRRASSPVILPQSHAGRLVAGLSAMVFPRPIGSRLGLIDIRGGRGLFFFADLDTIWFDATLALAIVALLMAFAERKWRSPVLWTVVAVTVLLALTLAYAISNFGTFFRHRDMILVLLAFVPVLVAAERQPAAALSASADAAESPAAA